MRVYHPELLVDEGVGVVDTASDIIEGIKEDSTSDGSLTFISYCRHDKVGHFGKITGQISSLYL